MACLPSESGGVAILSKKHFRHGLMNTFKFRSLLAVIFLLPLQLFKPRDAGVTWAARLDEYTKTKYRLARRWDGVKMYFLQNNYITNTDKPPVLGVLQDYGIPYRVRGEKALALCPYHSEKSPSFAAWPEQNRFHCFGCGTSGDSFDLLAHLSGRQLSEVLRERGRHDRVSRKIIIRRKAEARERQEQADEFNRIYGQACRIAQGLEGELVSYDDYDNNPEAVHLLATLSGVIEAVANGEITEAAFVEWAKERIGWAV